MLRWVAEDAQKSNPIGAINQERLTQSLKPCLFGCRRFALVRREEARRMFKPLLLSNAQRGKFTAARWDPVRGAAVWSEPQARDVCCCVL